VPAFVGWLGRQKFRLLSFCLPLCVYLLCLNGVYSSDYPTSILGMQYAMWARHSLSLGAGGNLIAQSADLSVFAGNYYSALSPGFAILSFPFAALGFVLDGNTLNLWGWSLVMDEVFVAICSAVAVLLVYEIARFYASERASLVAAFALAFATPLWPASTVLFIHGTSLMFAMSSIYMVLRYDRGKIGSRGLLAAGALLGLAGFVEYVALLFVVPLALYLAVRRFRRVLPVFLAGFSLGPAAQLTYNFVAFQNPFLFPEQLKGGASGSIISEFNLPSAVVHLSYYLVSPYRGILFFSPIAILGLYALLRLAGNRIPRRDAVLFISAFALPLVTYSSWTDWAGGLFYGPRFLILGFPSLLIPLAPILDEWRSRKFGVLVLALFGVSSFVEGAGALTTAFSIEGPPGTFQLAGLNLPWLLQGKLDSWWVSWANLPSGMWVILPVGTFALLWIGMTYGVLAGRLPSLQSVAKGASPGLPAKGKTKTIVDPEKELKT